MRLESGLGIRCDACGGSHQEQFTYYSLDFKRVEVVSDRATAQAESLPTIFSVDLCATCQRALADTIVKCYKIVAGAIVCDLCSVVLKGSFIFYYCAIAEVKVSMAAGRIECRQCHQIVPTKDKPCPKCQGTLFSKIADTKVDAKHLQCAVCEVDYQRIADRATQLRQLAASLTNPLGGTNG